LIIGMKAVNPSYDLQKEAKLEENDFTKEISILDLQGLFE